MFSWLTTKHDAEHKEEAQQLKKAMADFQDTLDEERRIQQEKINLVRLAEEALSLNLGSKRKEE